MFRNCLRLKRVDMSNVRESHIQKKLERELNGKHMKCPCGIPDIVTENELIEIKRWKRYKEAFGQLLFYQKYYPGRQLRIHFFDKKPKDTTIINDIFLFL